MGSMLSQILGLVMFVLFVAALGGVQVLWERRTRRLRSLRTAAIRRHPAGKAR